MNYLNEQHLRSFLSLGKTVEYWLGQSENINGFNTYKWISITKKKSENGDYSLVLYHVFDDRAEGLDDIYYFSSVGQDTEYGTIIFESEDFEVCLEIALEKFSVELDKFVPNGYINDFIKDD